MTRKEIIERNIGLTFDFVHYLIDNKDELNELPESFDVEFIDKDFPSIETKTETTNPKTKVSKKYVRVKRTFETV